MNFEKLSFELPNDIDNILDNYDEENTIISDDLTINKPQLNLGYNHFITLTKNKLDESWYISELKMNKKYKYIISPFEHIPEVKIDNFLNIHDSFKKYLNLKDKPKISSRSFFKLWEMIILFDLINKTDDNFTSFHEAEAPGGFILATILYNDKYNKKFSQKSKFYAITLNDYKKNIQFSGDLNNLYGRKTNKRYFQFKTNQNMNGDITKLSTIDTIQKAFEKKRPDLITADGGFDPDNENNQEQESYILLLGEIVTAILNQNYKGNFVCKFFDMYTDFSIKLLCIICQFYEKVYIYKPFMSRLSNSEKYIIAKNFKYKKDDSEYIKYTNILRNILKNCKEIQNKKRFIINIFPNYQINPELKQKIKEINLQFAYHQYNSVQLRLNLYKDKQYSSNHINKYLQIQKEATEFWTNKFLI